MNSELQQIEALTRQVSDLRFGLKFIAGIFLLIASLEDISLSLSITPITRIYVDVFHGQPLPRCTFIVIHAPILFLVLSIVWPIAGITSLLLKTRARLSFILLGIVLAATVLQSALLMVALQAPMINLFQSIQDNSGAR